MLLGSRFKKDKVHNHVDNSTLCMGTLNMWWLFLFCHFYSCVTIIMWVFYVFVFAFFVSSLYLLAYYNTELYNHYLMVAMTKSILNELTMALE